MAVKDPPAKPLRIAILEADTPLSQTNQQYGGYRGVFAKLLHAAAETLGWPSSALELSGFDVVYKQEYPELEQIDGILITGSKHCAFENDPWILKLVDYTKKVLADDRVRAIGVCFGHQILGRALEAPVTKNSDWEISVCKMDLTDKAKQIFGKDDLYIHQMHRDIVQELPKGVESLGASPICSVQGMYANGRLISVQGHPEFNGKIVQEIIEKRHEQKIFNDEVFNDAERRVNNSHDGVVIAAGFLKFMVE